MRGMYMVPKHGTLISEGKKKLIVKSKKFDIIGEPLILVEGHFALGEIIIKEIFEFPLSDFFKLNERHRISEIERKKWWPKSELFYGYEFSFKSFKEPREVVLKQGVQTFIGEVRFLDEFIVNFPEYDPAKVPNRVLADDWRIVCAWYSSMKSGREIRVGTDKILLTDEMLVDKAGKIYKEINSRVAESRMTYQFRPDRMAPNSKELFIRVQGTASGKESGFSRQDIVPLSTINQSGEGGTGEQIHINDFIGKLKSFKTRNPSVYLVGGLANYGTTKGDIDILIKQNRSEPVPNIPLEFRIYRQFPKELWSRFHFLYNDIGPFTNFVSLYDQAYLVKRPLNVVQMQSPKQDDFMIISSRTKDANKGFIFPTQGKKKDVPVLRLAYTGAKGPMMPIMLKKIPKGVKRIMDPMIGSGSFIYTAKNSGYEVLGNDILYAGKSIFNSIVFNDKEKLNEEDVEKLMDAKPVKGYLYNYKRTDVRSFTPNMRAVIDGMVMESKTFSPVKRQLFESALASTFWHFGSHTSSWGKGNIKKPKTLNVLKEYIRRRIYYINSMIDLNRDGSAPLMSGNEDCAKYIRNHKVDMVYLDPPYITEHAESSLYTSYFIVDEIISQRKRNIPDCAKWNKANIAEKVEAMVSASKNARYVMFSYKDNKVFGREKIRNVLKKYFKNVKLWSFGVTYTTRPGKHSNVKERELLFLATNMKKIEFQRADSAIKEMAEQSKEEDKCIPFRFFYQMKPMHGREPEEEYTFDIILRTINKVDPEWKQNGIFVGRKADGVTCQIHKIGKKVIVWTEDGGDITNNIPTIVKELSEMKNDFVCIGEIEHWKDGKRSPRAVTNGILHTKEISLDEIGCKVAFYDCFWINNKDIHRISYEKRRDVFIKLFSNKKNLWINPNFRTDTEDELKEMIEKCSKLLYSEGAIINDSTGQYNFALKPDGKFLKYKTEYTFIGKVVGIHRVKEAEKTYYYYCSIKDDKYRNVFAGRTFNTNIKAKIGDRIKVIFVDMSRYYDKEKNIYWYNWWSPRVKEITDEPITTTKRADEVVEETTGRYEEKLMPKYEEIEVYIEGIYQKTPSSIKALFQDPFLIYPPYENREKLKYAITLHVRGKSVHLDDRKEWKNGLLIGSTLFIPKGLSRVPKDIDDCRILLEKEIFPLIDKTLADPNKKFLATMKKVEPEEWLSMEGSFPPGTVGATKNEWGYMVTYDEGLYEPLSMKSYFHEYWYDGNKLKGKYVYREIENKKEWKKTGEGLMSWMFFYTKSPPYIVTKRAVEKNYMTPYPWSGLPVHIDEKIPEEYRYWIEKKDSDRIRIRDNLVKHIKEIGVSMAKTFPFVIQRHWWEDEAGNITEQHCDFRVDTGEKELIHFVFPDCPYVTKKPEMEVILKPCYDKASMNVGLTEPWKAPIDTPWNPTKNPECYVKTIQKGSLVILKNESDNKAFVVEGADMPYWYFSQIKDDAWRWAGSMGITKVEAEQKTEEDPLVGTSINANLFRMYCKGQFVIRAGPSKEAFYLNIGKDTWELEYSPLRNVSMTAYERSDFPDKLIGVPKEQVIDIEPGTPLNPSKERPCWLEKIETGSVQVLEWSTDFIKFKASIGRMKGLWVLKREEPKSEISHPTVAVGCKIWVLERSELPKALSFSKKNEDFSMEHSDYLDIKGILFTPGRFTGSTGNEVVLSEDVLKDSTALLPQKNTNLCYVNFYHQKDEISKAGIMKRIYWDSNMKYEVDGKTCKGALMYEATITDPTAVSYIKNKTVYQNSGEINYQTETDDDNNVVHIYVSGVALTTSPAVETARIIKACDQDTCYRLPPKE